jgi:hypothetical protein
MQLVKDTGGFNKQHPIKTCQPGLFRAGSHFNHTQTNARACLLSGDMLDKTHHVTGVAVLVVVPGHQLHEGAVQCNTGFSIKDR